MLVCPILTKNWRHDLFMYRLFLVTLNEAAKDATLTGVRCCSIANIAVILLRLRATSTALLLNTAKEVSVVLNCVLPAR